MKTIEISDEAYTNIQNLKKSFAGGNLLFPKIILSDEDVIDILALHYNRFYVQVSASIGIELKNEKIKDNWIETKEGLKKRKKIDRKNVIDLKKVN